MRVQGLRVEGSEFRAQVSGLRVQGSGWILWNLGIADSQLLSVFIDSLSILWG